MRSISEMNKKGMGEMIKNQLTLAWYFDKPYEKIILILLGILGLWKGLELIGGFL